MLKKTLILIAEGFNVEKELARELGVSEEELLPQLEDFCRKGYLKMSEEDTGMCVAGPNLKEDAGIGRIFSLTEKGKKLIR